jgi:methionine-rich copper-binding protein CopC
MHTPTAIVIFCNAMLICLTTWNAWGHAFPQRSEPPVGATLEVPPPRVRIWFDGALEAAFSSLHVQAENGRRLDKDDGHVDATDVTLLEVLLPPLPPGTYRVLWSVVARDGHRTAGEYTFTIQQGH